MGKASHSFLLLLAVAVAVVGFTAGPAPAQAASQYSTIKACVQAPSYWAGSTFWNPLRWGTYYVDVTDGIGQSSLPAQTLDSNGCTGPVLVSPGYSWRFRVSHWQSGLYYAGSTKWFYVPVAGNAYNYGTFQVTVIPVR